MVWAHLSSQRSSSREPIDELGKLGWSDTAAETESTAVLTSAVQVQTALKHKHLTFTSFASPQPSQRTIACSGLRATPLHALCNDRAVLLLHSHALSSSSAAGIAAVCCYCRRFLRCRQRRFGRRRSLLGGSTLRNDVAHTSLDLGRRRSLHSACQTACPRRCSGTPKLSPSSSSSTTPAAYTSTAAVSRHSLRCSHSGAA